MHFLEMLERFKVVCRAQGLTTFHQTLVPINNANFLIAKLIGYLLGVVCRFQPIRALPGVAQRLAIGRP